MTPTAPAGVVFPPRDLAALLDLGRFLDHHTEPAPLLGPDGEQVPLPEEVYRVVVEVVEAMREGRVITLVPGSGGGRQRETPGELRVLAVSGRGWRVRGFGGAVLGVDAQGLFELVFEDDDAAGGLDGGPVVD